MTHTGAPDRFDPAMVAGLDEPVRRYFRHAIRIGAPLAAAFSEPS